MNAKLAQLACGAVLLVIGLLSLAALETSPLPSLALVVGGAISTALALRGELERSSTCSLLAAVIWVTALLAYGITPWQSVVLLLLSLTPLVASAAAAGLSSWGGALEEEPVELAYIDEGIDFTLPRKLEEKYDFEFDEYGRLVKKKK